MKGNIWSISRIHKCFLLTAMVFSAVLAGGCKISKDDGKKVRDLEFNVVGESDVPEELKQIIGEKVLQPFKLTFNDEQNLYCGGLWPPVHRRIQHCRKRTLSYGKFHCH